MENKGTGGQIEDNNFEQIKKRQLQGYSSNFNNCNPHCYCRTVWIDSKEHFACCMCGNRQLKNPITF